MLRVLYKVGSPAENKQLADAGLKVPRLESGAQRASPPPSPAEAIKKSRKLVADREAAKRHAEEQAEAIRDRIWAEAQAQLFKESGQEPSKGDDVDESLAGLQNIERQRVADEDQWTAEHMGNVETFTGHRSDSTRDEVTEGLADMQQMERDRQESFDTRVARGEVVMGEELEVAVEKALESAPRQKTEAYKPVMPEIPVNVPASERALAIENLRRTLKNQTEDAYHHIAALEERFFQSPSAAERANLQHQMDDANALLDTFLKREFYADHPNPRQAEMTYEALASERRALLKNAEARRVYEKLDEQRPSGGWDQGHYITPGMIEELDPLERDFGRKWQRMEEAQMALSNGMEQIRNEREARAAVNKLQLKVLRNGAKFGISEDRVRAANLPNVNRGDLTNLADRTFADIAKHDVPQTAAERFLSAGIATAKFFGFDSLFGRKRANAEINALQKAMDRHDEISRQRRAGLNGPQIVLGGGGLSGSMIATDFGAPFARGSQESGVILSRKVREAETTLSLEQAEDLQGILTESRHMADALARNPESKSVQSSASELASELQARVLKYVDTPAARSRVYELANESLQRLERSLGEQFSEDVEEPSTAEQKQQPELTVARAYEVAQALQKKLDQPSALLDSRSFKADLARIEEALSGSDENSSLHKRLEDAYLDAKLRFEALEWQDADLPAVKPSRIERQTQPNEVNPDKLSSAQLERLDRATETLLGSQKGLKGALESGEPLGKMFIGSLNKLISDREGTLHLLTLNRLDKNPAAQDLREALQTTKDLLAEHQFLTAFPQAYRAVARARADVRALGTELSNSSQLVDNARAAARLEKLRGVVEQYRGTTVAESDAYDELQDAVRKFGEDLHGLNQEADLPAVGMSSERKANLERAGADVEKISAEMQSANLRAKKLSADVVTANGMHYRTLLQNARGLLVKLPSSMKDSAQAKALQTSLSKTEDQYQRWAKRFGERQLNKINTGVSE